MSTTLLVDTYDVDARGGQCDRRAGTGLGAVRIDSGDLGVLARQVRAQLDELGATATQIVVSGDLDEYSIAALRAEPVDTYGVGTSVVTGSGAPTAEHGLQARRGRRPGGAETQLRKESHGGRKAALRLSRPTGTIIEEVIHPVRATVRTSPSPPVR